MCDKTVSESNMPFSSLLRHAELMCGEIALKIGFLTKWAKYLDHIWKQIDTIEYLNRSTTTKLVSASFKSCTIIPRDRFASYRIGLNIGC